MSEELRKAAEVYAAHQICISNDEHRKSPYWLPLAEAWSERRFLDANALANAYLAEHPADGETAIDEAWLRSIGFRQWPQDDEDAELYSLFIPMRDELGWKCRLGFQANGFYAIRMADVDGDDDSLISESVELLGTRNMRPAVTRSDVRDLCRGLKIEMKG